MSRRLLSLPSLTSEYRIIQKGSCDSSVGELGRRSRVWFCRRCIDDVWGTKRLIKHTTKPLHYFLINRLISQVVLYLSDHQFFHYQLFVMLLEKGNHRLMGYNQLENPPAITKIGTNYIVFEAFIGFLG